VPQCSCQLGEIDTRSALNERFAAEIELLDTRDLEASEVIASLASTDDFRRVGVERFFFLTSLQFDVVRNGRGNLVITATSNQPITEPYLNFLVEVLWPSGRLLKEYTVLLDPPTFTHSAAAPVAAPTIETTDISSAGRVQRDQPVSSTPVAPARETRVRDAAEGTYGRTNRNDTMWAIASETLPSSSVTPEQNMIAIQRLNPNAFIDGNVNLLKEGVVLRLPSEGDAQAIDNSSAVAEIKEQSRAWRSGTPARSVAANAADQAPQQAAAIDATSRGPGNAGQAAATSDGRLRIVAADSAGAVGGVDNTGASDGQTSTAGDSAAQERIAALAREVDSLTYQLDLQKRGVDEQISSREKQINLKDQQIAQLQAQLREAQQNAASQPAAQSTAQDNGDAAVEETPFWQKPAVLGGVLGGLALLLAGVLFKRRKSNDADELVEYEPEPSSFELADSASEEFATPVADADLVGDLNDADDALAGAAHKEANLSEELSGSMDTDDVSDDDLFGPADDDAQASDEKAAQTTDVISEADIYIAYGRYPQAISLLQGAVESDPSDHAVRVRLLEVCAETKDAQGYAEQASLLKQHCSDAGPLNAADSLYSSLDDDFQAQVADLMPADDGGGSLLSGATGAAAGAGAAVVAGAAALFSGDSDASEDESESSADAEPFAFDTTVTDNSEVDAPLDDFELDLDTGVADEIAGAADDLSPDDLNIDSVDTGEFATNVDMEPAVLDQVVEPQLDEAIGSAEAVEDFELDLDLSSDTDDLSAAQLDDALGDNLGLELPDETVELERVVSEADDDQLLDEIERSLDELEADGLLTPDLDEDAQFSFDDDADTSATKLDLARAYIDMGDDDGAREILGEVISEGDSNQQGEASELLGKL